MAQVDYAFLPVSHLSSAGRTAGFTFPWANQCDRCDRQCEISPVRGLGTCTFGVNFYRLTPDILLFGFIIQGARQTQAQRKALKQNPHSVLRPATFDKLLATFSHHEQSLLDQRTLAVQEMVEDYKSRSMYKAELLELMRPDIQKSLSFLHDYKQFVARVKQNINVVLQTRFPDEAIDAQLQKASKAEAAIYWSAALMDDKLQTAFLLMHPERLAGAEKTRFRLHGFVLKHIRIYEAAFAERDIRVIQKGHSVGEIIAAQAFAAIPHTLLDNALKYSSRGCQVVIGFQEDEHFIDFSVTSHGPKIEEDESTKIFDLFYRGVHGIVQEEEGSGFGLYLAQFIAKDLGSEIKLRQSPQKTKCGYETTFSIRLARSG